MERRFNEDVYSFVLQALLYAVIRRIIEAEDLSVPKQVSSKELAHAVRELALEEFGLLARTVLNYWGIKSTLDIGEVVRELIDLGIMQVGPDDHIAEDFDNIYDFETAFEYTM